MAYTMMYETTFVIFFIYLNSVAQLLIEPFFLLFFSLRAYPYAKRKRNVSFETKRLLLSRVFFYIVIFSSWSLFKMFIKSC